jgi:hypothetical protein
MNVFLGYLHAFGPVTDTRSRTMAETRIVLGDKTNTFPILAHQDRKLKSSLKRRAKLDPSQRPLKFAKLHENINPDAQVSPPEENKQVKSCPEPLQIEHLHSGHPSLSCPRLLRHAASSSRTHARLLRNCK